MSAYVASEVEAGEAGPGGEAVTLQENHPADVDVDVDMDVDVDVDVDTLLAERTSSHRYSRVEDHAFHPLRACQQFAVHIFFPISLAFNCCGLGCAKAKNQVRLVRKGQGLKRAKRMRRRCTTSLLLRSCVRLVSACGSLS
jgi:hypothetical protein